MRLHQWGELPGKTWLDVGCGNGALVSILGQKGWDAVGMDIDPMPALAQGILPIESWDQAGAYDVISYVDCLEHSFVYDELPEAARHLNEDGVIVVEFPVAQEEERHYRRLQHLWFFDEETFAKMVDHYGFEVRRMVKPLSGKRSAVIGRKK
jgi:2-polyprenyl-3-methyl-5-hydroxy-6-metoxy-1,4-benzoquinol methylase